MNYTQTNNGFSNLLNPYDYKLSLKKLIENGSAVANSKAIEDIINEDVKSKQKLMAKAGDKYYLNEADILSYHFNEINMPVTNRDSTGKPLTTSYKQIKSTGSDNKVSIPFFYNIINQKIEMALSSGITFTSKEEQFLEIAKEYFNETFDNDIIELAIKASKQGQSALHFFYAEDSDDLQYSIIDGSEFIPIYDSKTGKTLEQVIRYYNQEIIIDGDNKTVTKVEIWHSVGVEYWERIDKTFVFAGFKPILTISTILNDSVKKVENFDFGKVPFAVLKNNQDCLSDINEIKTLIDDYNFISSLTSNDIADLRQSFLFVSGVSDNADELRQNINLYKVATSPDKDASMLSVVIPLESEAREKKLDRLKQDIYSMSSSVDFYDASFRNAISGEAIKKLMYPLDLKVNRFLRQVSSFLRDTMYFIVTDINRLYGKNYKVKDLEWIFKTNQIINTTETINNIIMLYSSNLIDLQEALDLLPLDINKEELLKRLESQNTLPDIEEEDDSNTAE